MKALYVYVSIISISIKRGLLALPIFWSTHIEIRDFQDFAFSLYLCHYLLPVSKLVDVEQYSRWATWAIQPHTLCLNMYFGAGRLESDQDFEFLIAG